MSHSVLPQSASTPLSFKARHPWLSCLWDGGRIWAARLGCVWVYPEDDADLE